MYAYNLKTVQLTWIKFKLLNVIAMLLLVKHCCSIHGAIIS